MSINPEDHQVPVEVPAVEAKEPVNQPMPAAGVNPTTRLQASTENHSAIPQQQPFSNDQSLATTDSHQAQNQPHYTSQGYPYSIWPAVGLPEQTDVTSGDKDGEPTGWEIAKAVVREIVETVVLTLIIFFLIQLVIRNFRVDGHSMDPNLHHGQYLVVDKISYNLPFGWREPQRGDVVVFEPPTYPDKDFVKRIIGLPGDTVDIRQGQVYINSEPLIEPFGAYIDRYSMGIQTVPEGQYFVMGDNRANSNDSRNWGALDADKIVGRAWVSYWPPATWGVISNDAPTNNGTLFNWVQSLTE